MDELTKHLTTLVNDTLATRDWYQWRMPSSVPAGIATPPGSGYEQTRALKRAIANLYLRDPDRRVELATYFVRDWGGVRGNRPETLQRYVESEVDAVIASNQSKGISSWSKVLHLRNPQRFFIYDARIAVVLNLVQVNYSLQQPTSFPMPSSQNRVIKLARQRLRALSKIQRWQAPTTQMYHDYNAMLIGIGERLSIEADVVEMALFSQAPVLASTWLTSP